jgi:hypothetical protein
MSLRKHVHEDRPCWTAAAPSCLLHFATYECLCQEIDGLPMHLNQRSPLGYRGVFYSPLHEKCIDASRPHVCAGSPTLLDTNMHIARTVCEFVSSGISRT